MANSGFDIIESFEGSKTSNTDWLSSNFSLPVDFPDNLMTFVHLNFDLGTIGIVSIIKNGISYPLNTSVSIVGDVFRSIPIIKGVTYNFQCDTTQTNLKFVLALEK